LSLEEYVGERQEKEGTLWLEIIARRDRYSGNTYKITELYILDG